MNLNILLGFLCIFRVKGIENLRVVDVFVMCFVFFGIINVLMIMIVEKVVDMILGKDIVKDIIKYLYLF